MRIEARVASQTFRDPFAGYRLNGPIGHKRRNAATVMKFNKALALGFLNFMNFMNFLRQVEGATLRP
jgi:hypothetical protein